MKGKEKDSRVKGKEKDSRVKGKEKDSIEERKKAFLKEMRLDLGVENKLNKIIKKD